VQRIGGRVAVAQDGIGDAEEPGRFAHIDRAQGLPVAGGDRLDQHGQRCFPIHRHLVAKKKCRRHR